jgi:hypothetical protein
MNEKMNKEEIKLKETDLLNILKEFCNKYLDDDYYNLCEKLVKKMARKKEVPFLSGKQDIWAAAIIHALGSINFLFDKSFEPYITLDQINDYFETKKSTVSTKSNQIRKMFKMGYYDKEFSTQAMNESNPFNDMVMINGFIVPVSMLPENIQEMVEKNKN